MRDTRWPRGAYAAEFADERHFAGAVATLAEQGYSRLETYTPYPVPRVDAVLRPTPSFLPALVFVAGLSGGAIGYWIQWFANAVSYPMNIGGRPAHAAPAFFIPTFESIVLAAALAAFVALFASLGLPRPWHPLFEVEGIESATVDHFWIALAAADDAADDEVTPKVLGALKPLRVVRVPPFG